MSVISDVNKKKLADFIDNLVKFKNPVLEGVDNWAFKFVIGTVDENFLVKIKPEYHQAIDDLAGKIADKDFQGAADAAADILSIAINTPIVDGTPAEQEMYGTVLKLVANLVETWVESKKN